ncbi:MAG: metallophosphoesterase [Clostridia bacterium]|nr:metallophosphoesterase [Clostridia bacterium]
MYKLKIVADLHHFPESLSDGGRAYQLRSSSDQVCLCESGAIIDAAFENIANSDCDAVLIAGDLSNDGEKIAHDEMLEKIKKLSEKKKVFVIYSTHDWCCNGDARRFVGDKAYNDVETATAPYLREFYKDYGENQAYDTYENEIGAVSYAVKLDGKVRLIGLNDDRNGKGKAGYCDEHFEWILKQVRDAKANGEAVIIMEHHLVLPHISRLINGGQMIGDADERAEALAEAGVDFIIVGHSHMQRTTQYTAKNGNVMTQINVGSLCGHPSPITTLTVTDEEFRIDVDRLQKFTYNGTEYTNEYITEHTKDVLMGLLNSAANDKEEFIARFNGIDEKLKYDGKYYGIISKAARWLLKMTVGKAGRLINFFTFGKGVNKQAVKQIKNDNLVEHIMDIYLCVFDGSLKKCSSTNDPVYIIVKDVASLPKRISRVVKIKTLQKEKIQKVFTQIEELAEELTNPSLPDNQHAVIGR